MVTPSIIFVQRIQGLRGRGTFVRLSDAFSQSVGQMLDPLPFVSPGTEQAGAYGLRQRRYDHLDDDRRHVNRAEAVALHHLLTLGAEWVLRWPVGRQRRETASTLAIRFSLRLDQLPSAEAEQLCLYAVQVLQAGAAFTIWQPCVHRLTQGAEVLEVLGLVLGDLLPPAPCASVQLVAVGPPRDGPLQLLDDSSIR
jgi:hypothetical protein